MSDTVPWLLHGRDAASPAMVAADAEWTRAALAGAVDAAAASLAERGVRPADHVALILPVDPDLVRLFLAVLRLGAVACPLNPQFPPAYQRELVAAARCTALIAPPAASIEAIDGVQTLDADAVLHASATSILEPLLHVPALRPASVVFTSGSTGTPKAALHAYGNHFHSALRANRGVPLESGDRWLLSLPLHHVAGIGVVCRALLAGAAIAVPGPGEPLEHAIQRMSVSHVSLVAAQLQRLMAAPGGLDVLRGLKVILLGGGPVPRHVVDAAHAAGLPLHKSYGLTETAALVTCTPPRAALEDLFTAGRPLAPDTLRVASSGGIHVRGDALFLGYLHADGSITRPLLPGGWFDTGDLGMLDPDGRLIVTGRRDNRFVAGGENIQPEEIEAALRRCKGVEDAVVVPQPHPEFGEVPVAFVRMCSGAPPDEAALRAALAGSLPRFKLPRRCYPWPGDRAAGGMKPSRRDLRARARELGEAGGGIE